MEPPTNTTLAPTNGSLYTYPELVFTAVMCTMLTVVAIVGNILVLVAVARTKRLQNVTNVFVVNLSISDCLCSFAFLWSVPGMVSKTPGYPIQSNIPCVVSAALAFIAVGCSLYSLANIALNRLILITRPKDTYQWLYTPKKTALIVLGSWLIPISTIVIPPLFGIGDVGFDPESRTCSDVDTHPRGAVYDKIQFAAFYPLPFLVIVVSYVLIWRHVRRHFKNRRQVDIGLRSTSTDKRSAPLSTLSTDDDDASSTRTPSAVCLRHAESTRQLRSRSRNDQLAITKNLFVVVFAFAVCFTPLCIMVVSKSNRYQLYGALTLFVSGCINPIIYAAKHPHFRPVLRSMVLCRCSKE